MRYVFKDLMVTVLQEDADGPHCPTCSLISCDLPTVACGPVTCPLTSVIPSKVESADSLFLLKKELEYALAQVSEAEAAVRENLRPKNAADVDFLEQRLSAALDDLRQHKDSYPSQ